MGACYSHIAIAHPYPGGFSRNGVEKVWLHRSFLATLACMDVVTRGSRQKRLCGRCEHAAAPHCEGPPHTIGKISSNREARLGRHPQFGGETPAASAAPTHRLQAADHCRPRTLPARFLPLAE